MRLRGTGPGTQGTSKSPDVKVKVSHSVESDSGFLDCSPPGSSVHGISQARILEWVASPSSRGSS